MMTPISSTRFGITTFSIALALALGSAADAQTAQSKLSPDGTTSFSSAFG